jgi:hypothetical protein
MVRGLNRLLPKEIRSRERWNSEESQKTGLKPVMSLHKAFLATGSVSSYPIN